MADTEWFYGRSVDEPYEPYEQRYAPHRFAAVIFVAGLVLALLLGVGGCANVQTADVPVYVYEDETKIVKLMPGPCVHQSVKDFVGAASPELAARWKAIESTWHMRDGTRKPFVGCWIEFTAEEVGYEAFGLLFEDGERYLLNKAEFLRKDGGV